MTDPQRQQRFEALLGEHQRIVFKVAGIYAHHAEDRRDLAQEIVVQLWRSFGRYDERQAKFSTWMYRIALNVAISDARHRRRSLAGRLEPLEPRHLETITGGQATADRDERLDALYAFIGELDALNRALILLYLEDRSYAEIADILGISETNVATKISRIKQTLRGQMTGPDAGSRRT
jgi:RNA polymerase sigma factor (sigma-70 family)